MPEAQVASFGSLLFSSIFISCSVQKIAGCHFCLYRLWLLRLCNKHDGQVGAHVESWMQ